MKNNKLLVLYFVLIILVAAVAATKIMLWATEKGVGISPDSTTYMATANSLLEGNGFYVHSEPMTHFPPVYPVILAISGIFNSDVAGSARWLHVLLYSINTILFGLLVFVSTRRNLLSMPIGFILFISSSAILASHSYALSEPPFITFMLISFLLLFLYISSNRWIFLVLSSVSLGLAIATRYVGIALIPPVIIVLFLFVAQPLKRKLKNIFTMLIIAITPISIWVIRNLLIIQSATDRSLIYHVISNSKIKDSINSFHSFILPNYDSVWANAIEIFIIAGILIYFILIIFKNRAVLNESDSINKFFIIFGIVLSISYVLFLIFSISFLDAATPLKGRILVPVYLFLSMSVFSTVFLYSQVVKKQVVWSLFIVCVLFSARTSISPMMSAARELNENGIGYNSLIWNESPTLSILKSMNPDVEIFTNGRDVISFKTEFEPNHLPLLFYSGTLVQNKYYAGELRSVCDKVAKGDAIIVYFERINRPYFPTEVEIQRKCGLPVLYQNNDDGTIFGLPAK